jgi:hypothetical protein
MEDKLQKTTHQWNKKMNKTANIKKMCRPAGASGMWVAWALPLPYCRSYGTIKKTNPGGTTA